jgi:hypothetical protein
MILVFVHPRRFAPPPPAGDKSWLASNQQFLPVLNETDRATPSRRCQFHPPAGDKSWLASNQQFLPVLNETDRAAPSRRSQFHPPAGDKSWLASNEQFPTCFERDRSCNPFAQISISPPPAGDKSWLASNEQFPTCFERDRSCNPFAQMSIHPRQRGINPGSHQRTISLPVLNEIDPATPSRRCQFTPVSGDKSWLASTNNFPTCFESERSCNPSRRLSCNCTLPGSRRRTTKTNYAASTKKQLPLQQLLRCALNAVLVNPSNIRLRDPSRSLP